MFSIFFFIILIIALNDGFYILICMPLSLQIFFTFFMEYSLKWKMEAAKAAQLHDFILSLPEGYNTNVGERGVDLSGGQKQRLAIARALLTNAKIIIFDASTSSVDTETEHEIQRALETVLKNRTTFIITQRLSTVKNADRMLVLDKGQIVEEGTHNQLMEKKGLYYRLYQTQLEEIAEGPRERD